MKSKVEYTIRHNSPSVEKLIKLEENITEFNKSSKIFETWLSVFNKCLKENSILIDKDTTMLLNEKLNTKAMFANGYRESLEKSSDVQLEEIDNARYDKLINRYLKENYANVKSYTTTEATLDDEHNKAILEGVITFKSGVEKKTKFVFEAREITKKGQLKLVGSNKTFTESAKAFTLLGRVNNKRLISESLSYRYTAGDKKVKGKIEPLRKR